jgi:hypothetical protein
MGKEAQVVSEPKKVIEVESSCSSVSEAKSNSHMLEEE